MPRFQIRLAALATLLAACSPFAPDLPAQPFLCGSGSPACPDGYACVTDHDQRICADTSGSAVDGGAPPDVGAIDAPASTCEHDPCTTGTKLTATCDSCVQQICSADSYCCDTKWSSECVAEVSSICGEPACPGS